MVSFSTLFPPLKIKNRFSLRIGPRTFFSRYVLETAYLKFKIKWNCAEMKSVGFEFYLPIWCEISADLPVFLFMPACKLWRGLNRWTTNNCFYCDARVVALLGPLFLHTKKGIKISGWVILHPVAHLPLIRCLCAIELTKEIPFISSIKER